MLLNWACCSSSCSPGQSHTGSCQIMALIAVVPGSFWVPGVDCLQDGQLRLLYRHSPGSTVHCFKASCVLPAPMEVRQPVNE